MRFCPWLVVVGASFVLGFGCSSNDGSSENGTPEEEESFIVAPGKEDNFLSNTAQEYMVEGITSVTIESYLASASEEEKLARVHELIPLKHVVLGWFLNAYIVEKSQKDDNKDYGGFKGLTKNGAYEELNIEALDDTTYQFTFRQVFGGKLDLLDKMPTTMGSDGRRYFDLTIGKISNQDMQRLETNAEWYRSSPWSSFDPSTIDPSRLDTVTMAVWPEPRSIDAWFDYNRLFEDGKLTMGIHFGWDYHNEYHIVHSRDVYNWLVNTQRFTSPVGSYDEYTRTSGPLTKTIDANGKPVQVEISLYWGKPGTDTDPDTDAGGRQLEADMRTSFRDRDVIMFSGHSGPFYGFALANWRKTDEGDLDDSEIPFMDMPADKYQVVIAEGCDTYSLGQSFRMNPNKADAKNIDIITTTSFSNASTSAAVRDSIKALIGLGTGPHEPVTFLNYLRDMDDNSYWFSTMYGVHGLDDNPHAHPYAVLENLCKTCSVNSECGGVGNKCSRLNTTEKFCTFECTSDGGCPEGYQCLPAASGYVMTSMQCAPINLTCTAPPTEPTGPSAILNEVFASPKADGGDANGDGIVHFSEDEFVEIVNVTNQPVDLTGWRVADTYMTRFAFPPGTVLQPGKAALIFGGGDETAFSNFDGVAVFVSGNQLGLNNTGDRVTMSDKSGRLVDEMSYGREGGNGVALVREIDGDPEASWVLHAGRKHSAGLRSDGSPF